MDSKPTPYIPAELLKTQRVEVYINDLQARLQQLRNKPDNIFTECCEILKGIQDVSSHTISKQPEINKIIQEFEELGKKNSTNQNVHKKSLTEKVGDAKRMKDKFEKIFLENLSDFIVRGSVEESHEFQSKINNNNQEDMASFLTTLQSIYSLRKDSTQNYGESICLDREELEKDFD